MSWLVFFALSLRLVLHQHKFEKAKESPLANVRLSSIMTTTTRTETISSNISNISRQVRMDDRAYRGAIALNNMGVTLLHKNHFVEAYETLQDSSRIMRRLVTRVTTRRRRKTSGPVPPSSFSAIASSSVLSSTERADPNEVDSDPDLDPPIRPFALFASSSHSSSASNDEEKHDNDHHYHHLNEEDDYGEEEKDVASAIDRAARRLAATMQPPTQPRRLTRSASAAAARSKNNSIHIQVVSDDLTTTTITTTTNEATYDATSTTRTLWDMILNSSSSTLSSSSSSFSPSSAMPHVFFPIRIEAIVNDDTVIDSSSLDSLQNAFVFTQGECSMKCAIILHNVAVAALCRSKWMITQHQPYHPRTTNSTRGRRTISTNHMNSKHNHITNNNNRKTTIVTKAQTFAYKLLELSYTLILRQAQHYRSSSSFSSPAASPVSPASITTHRPSYVHYDEPRRCLVGWLVLHSLVQALHYAAASSLPRTYTNSASCSNSTLHSDDEQELAARTVYYQQRLQHFQHGLRQVRQRQRQRTMEAWQYCLQPWWSGWGDHHHPSEQSAAAA